MSEVTFDVDVDDARVRRAIREANRNSRDLRPVWKETDDRFTEQEQEQWRSEGEVQPSPGRSDWEPLSPRYKAQKQREPGIREGLMERSGRLKQSLVNPFSPGSVHKVDRLSYERGTKVTSDEGFPYPVAHRDGFGDLPVRPILAWDEDDSRWLADRLEDHLADPFG